MAQNIPNFVINQFDENFYLQTYPDIAAAGVDPKAHFLNFGWHEGRWPNGFGVVDLDFEIWSTELPALSEEKLSNIVIKKESPASGLAAWFLCRWLASWGRWEEASQFIPQMLIDEKSLLYIRHQGPYLLAFNILIRLKQYQKAKDLLDSKGWLNTNDKLLARSMLERNTSKLDRINEVFAQHHLSKISAQTASDLNSIEGEADVAKIARKFTLPLVSVIVPCFNSQATLHVALKSICSQTYEKLEIIVVNDASTDDSSNVINEFVKKDRRVRHIELPENSGAYAARNMGLSKAKGHLITTHDADDWSHPEKIARQVKSLLENKSAVACLSHWVRCDKDLNFERWRMEDGWIYRNISSLMFRRKVHRKIGYWDNVSVNADTEFFNRIAKVFGGSKILDVLPGVPLAFGRVDAGSLTQNSTTHLRTQFRGLRKEYMESATKWHNSVKRLFMPKSGKRMFVVPPHICRGEQSIRERNLKEYLADKKLFDAKWYEDKNQDVKASGIEPLLHFTKFGVYEGRDPHPSFSLSAFSLTENKNYFESVSLWASDDRKQTSTISIKGNVSIRSTKRVLMVGHLAGAELFGAERSFLDCVEMLFNQGAAIEVVLPEAKCPDYIKEIQKYVKKIHFIPLAWWHAKRTSCETTISLFESVIDEFLPKCVYINTLTLWEPYLAAKNKKIETLTHVRELPEFDKDLCDRLGADPTTIRESVIKLSSRFIANSQASYNYIDLPNKTLKVHNMVRVSEFLDKSEKIEKGITAVMLSSNTKKKGVEDFFSIARLCAKRNIDIKFKLYGPNTVDLTACFEKEQAANISYEGYTHNTVSTLQKADVVLNLSHFQESFGRTVIEGMAAGCVVVAYNWGAIPEILTQDTGVLVEKGDVHAVADRLQELSNEPSKLQALAACAKIDALSRFDISVIEKQLSEAVFLNEENCF
ncbi:glycosyltransferase [Alteromonas sp. McT4-15]|uniref:glycosyltransferase n=1 Tax=Alteromonas sp. McT4-15 TaxID=2881256 RepID=UPI001CF90E3A|nr:glycosyltransferase [Alteromonas sp. McT4-15]MCB4438259.1 glycosyltransferase [Alteromonas sp. McT4-15]